MSEPHDPFSFDADFGGPEPIKAEKDDRPSPSIDGETWGARGIEAPIVKGDGPTPFEDLDNEAETPAAPAENSPANFDADFVEDNPADEFEAATVPLCPSRPDINAHLYALFSPEFVKNHPDEQIEIAYADPGEKPDAAKQFSVFELQKAADFAEARNRGGRNVYIGPAMRKAGSSGRASKADVTVSAYAWSDSDKQGDFERIDAICVEKNLIPAKVVVTGRTPHLRVHVYVKLAGKVTPNEVENANTALKTLFGSDSVQNVDRIMRLAGTINYPTEAKRERGYIAELVTLRINPNAPAYTVEHLAGIAGMGAGKTSDPFEQLANQTKRSRADDEVVALLEASRIDGKWHNSVRDAVATMLGRGWSDSAIRMVCKPYCRDGYGDRDLDDFIDRGRRKWNRPDVEQAAPAPADDGKLLGWDAGDDDTIPPPRGWLLGTSFCRGFASSLPGDGGVGKTAVRYAQMLSLATQRRLTGEYVFERCRVLVLSLEDGPDELRRRLLAARLHHGVDRDELKGWLFMDALGKPDGKLMTLDQHNRPIVGILAAKLERTIIERKIDLVMLDPFIKTHAIGENDNNGIDEVAQILTDLCIKYDIAVDVPHHMSKGAADPGNANRGRGASALKDALRLVRTATAMTPEEAKALGLNEAQRRRLIRIDDAKLNITPAADAKWFRLVGVDLGNATDLYPNGDNVQTVEPWSPPELFADISIKVINQILDEIEAGPSEGSRYSDAKNVADERAAWSVVARHCPGKGKGPAARVIKTWRDSGLLIAKNYYNTRTRKDVSGLWVDNLKRPT